MVIYNVATQHIDRYQDLDVILRGKEIGELLAAADQLPAGGLAGLELTTPVEDLRRLWIIENPVPLHVVVANSQEHRNLLNTIGRVPEHVVARIEIACEPGFADMLRTAEEMGYAVKLNVTQPNKHVVDQLLDILEYYLRQETVSKPVEFFHSLLRTFFVNTDMTIWRIQEEDPSVHRYVTDEGIETASRRLAWLELPKDPTRFLDDLRIELLLEQGECSTCAYFANCIGYFKFPDRTYSCADVKVLLGQVKEAANELRKDYQDYLDFKQAQRKGA